MHGTFHTDCICVEAKQNQTITIIYGKRTEEICRHIAAVNISLKGKPIDR